MATDDIEVSQVNLNFRVNVINALCKLKAQVNFVDSFSTHAAGKIMWVTLRLLLTTS